MLVQQAFYQLTHVSLATCSFLRRLSSDIFAAAVVVVVVPPPSSSCSSSFFLLLPCPH